MLITNLKHVYITYFSDELQNELHISIIAAKKELATTSIGQIHQMALAACDKLCEQEKFFKDFLTKKSSLKKACLRSHLHTKCKKKTCQCGPSHASHHTSQLSKMLKKKNSLYTWTDE